MFTQNPKLHSELKTHKEKHKQHKALTTNNVDSVEVSHIFIF